MKLWEVIKELPDDPTKVATAYLEESERKLEMSVVRGTSRYFNLIIYDAATNTPISENLGGGGFNGNVPLDLDWQLVRQPVTWQEAIQAWADGKKVVWEEDGERRVFDRNKSWAIPKYQSHLLDQDGDAVTIRMVSGGKWYVED